MENRKKSWTLISRFYLDTELGNEDYNNIVHEFSGLNFSLEELQEIDLYEVFPALQKNLLSVAGVWDGFNEEWLQDQCMKNYKQKTKLIFRFKVRLLNYVHFWMRQKHWAEIRDRMTVLKE